MGMHWSSFFDQLFRRSTATDNSSYFSHMRRSYASPPSSAATSASHRLKPTAGTYQTRHSAPPIPPPKSSPPAIPTTPVPHHPSPQPARRPATIPRSKLQTKVRDFAFPSTDDRYIGLGPTAPKASQFPRLNKKLGGSKRARPTVSATPGHIEAVPLGDDDGAESSDYPEDEEEEDDRPRIQFGPRFGAFFDSDSDSDSDDDDGRPGAKGGAASGVRGGRPGFSFRK